MVYCHTFSGNKLEGFSVLQQVLGQFTAVVFDFRGCGNTKDEFVTLGLREKDDLVAVLKAVDAQLNPRRIYLWGRSMGAVTIIHLMSHFEQEQAKKNDLIKKSCKYLVKMCTNLTDLKRDFIDMMESSELETVQRKYEQLKQAKNSEDVQKLVEKRTKIEKREVTRPVSQSQVKTTEDQTLTAETKDSQDHSTSQALTEDFDDAKKSEAKSLEPQSLAETPQTPAKTETETVTTEWIVCAEFVPLGDKIAGIVLDSPFTDSHKLVQDIMTNNMNVSSFTAKTALFFVSRTIRNNLKYDVLGDNRPIDKIKAIKVPALFMIGDRDVMVSQEQFKKMFDLCDADHKSLRYLQDTEHADCRSQVDLEFAINFIDQTEEVYLMKATELAPCPTMQPAK